MVLVVRCSIGLFLLVRSAQELELVTGSQDRDVCLMMIATQEDDDSEKKNIYNNEVRLLARDLTGALSPYRLAS